MNGVKVKEDDELLQEELEEDDEELTEEEGGAAFEAPQGLIVGALRAPKTTSYNVKHLNGSYSPTEVKAIQSPPTDLTAMLELMHWGEIDLEPEYQRDVVWSDLRQEALIDSLFHNYYIPPILFALRLEDDGSERRTCIDGKQRLTAIALFMSGLIPWRPKSGPGKGKRYWYAFPEGEEKRKGLELPPREKRLFETKTIVCAEFESLPEMAERDIFQRVQMGMALTPAEKLQALNTPLVKYISTLLQDYIHEPENGLTLYLTEWDRSRGKDFQNLAIIMSIIEAYPEKRNNFGAGSLQIWVRRPEPIEDSLKKKMETALDCMIQIARDYPEQSVSVVSRRISPLEFCFMGLISYALSEFYVTSQIAALYGQYRMHMRSTYEKGVRTDAAAVADSYRWLERVPKKKRNVRPVEEPIAAASPNRAKRVRRSADDDYAPAPIRSAAGSFITTRSGR